jgi:membrane protein implicated in regulation of membrane protease activity
LPGIAGIGLVTAGLGMSLMGSGASPSAVVSALAQVTVSLAAAVGLLVVLLAALPKLLPRAAARSGIVLHAQIGGGRDRETPGVRGADAAAFDASGHSGHSGHSGLDRTEATTLVGAMGATLTPLRPAGRALFHGEPIDVVSDGPFLASGEPVRVVRQDGGRVVVRRHEKSEDSAGR